MMASCVYILFATLREIFGDDLDCTFHVPQSYKCKRCQALLKEKKKSDGPNPLN